MALAIREKTVGRAIILATAADAVLAGQLASRLGFIDEVYASDGERNLKGSTKADTLRRLFPAGFIYAGDSKAIFRYGPTPAASSSSTRANRSRKRRVRWGDRCWN